MRAFLLTLLLGAAGQALAAADERMLGLARAQKDPFLASVKEFVEIESGSHDREGLDRLAGNIATRLKALGAEVQFFDRPADIARIETTPARPGRVVVGTLHAARRASCSSPTWTLRNS